MKKIIVAAVIGAVSAAFAEGEATFGGWRLSVGGNMAFGAKARMSYARNAFGVVPGGAFNPANPGTARYEFDNGAYIDMSDQGGAKPGDTRNWQIPASMTRPVEGGRAFDFSNTQLGGGSVSDDGMTLGASLELSRTLYAAENGFGLDVAFGVSWMMCNDILNGSAQAGYDRTTSSFTPTEPGYPPSADGSRYGGNFGTGDMYFAAPYDWEGPTPSSGTYSTHVSADYDEFELSLMLKPWYELTDWWRIYGNIGMGFGCGRFDFSMNAVLDGKTIYNLNEDECEWDFYGIAGGGTVFRLGSFDLSFDILYRFCQDDINVGNQYVNCTIEKPDLVFRLAIGYEF